MYNIADLETFILAARHGGVTSAARTQSISAATASHRISKLEQTLGIVLFHRNNRSFSLTEEGAVFFERVEKILEDLRQAEVEAGSGDTKIRGHLRVTMSPWILTRFILPTLPAFRVRHPDLTIEFLAVDRFVPLIDEGQDCAVRIGTLADSSLIARKVCDNSRIVCAAPDFLDRVGVPENADALERYDWVCLPWQRRYSLIASSGKSRTVTMERSVLVSNSDMLTDAAINGLGFAVKSKLAVQDELDSGQLVEVLPGCLETHDAPIWFVSPSGTQLSQKTRLFGEMVDHAFSKIASPRNPARR